MKPMNQSTIFLKMENKKINALVIVAHPDDETIWMGGTILMNQNYEWTIISLCRKHDSDRAPKFQRVCKALNHYSIPIISDLDDEVLKPLSIEEVKRRILFLLPKTTYDIIYTHGSNGEYGHIRHIETHKAVVELYKENKLKSSQLKFFSYIKTKKETPANPGLYVHSANPLANEYVKLNLEIFKRKHSIIKDMYGFDERGFEVMCSGNSEAYDNYKK